MTMDQQLDRCERMLRRCCEAPRPSRRASRDQTKKLKAYVDAITKCELMRAAYEAHPEDPKKKEGLVEATEILNQAVEELRGTLKR